VLVSGLVQGVGFRLSTAAGARSRGLAGWVRNRADGGVEAVFEGPDELVAEMVRWCERGPRGARVERVESIDELPEGTHGFAIRG
jgi:acylphosphatase